MNKLDLYINSIKETQEIINRLEVLKETYKSLLITEAYEKNITKWTHKNDSGITCWIKEVNYVKKNVLIRTNTQQEGYLNFSQFLDTYKL